MVSVPSKSESKISAIEVSFDLTTVSNAELNEQITSPKTKGCCTLGTL